METREHTFYSTCAASRQTVRTYPALEGKDLVSFGMEETCIAEEGVGQ